MEIALLILFLLINICGIYLTYRYFASLRTLKRTDGPACNRCGYSTRGLDSHICPECGTNLLETGVRVQGTSTNASIVKLILWTVAAIVIGSMIILMIDRYFSPKLVTKSKTISIIFSQTAVILRADLSQRVSRWHGSWDSGELVQESLPVDIRFMTSSSNQRLTLENLGTSWGNQSDSFNTGSDLAIWLAARTSIPERDLIASMDVIYQELKSMQASQYTVGQAGMRMNQRSGSMRIPSSQTYSVHTSNITTVRRSELLHLLLIALAFLIWGWGVHRILKTRNDFIRG